MSEAPEIFSRVERAVGRFTLNRPGALHALTLAMCHEMIDHLNAWRHSGDVSLVMIDHAGERGFCAGGDIRNLAAGHAGDGSPPRNFFYREYQLDHQIFTYEKPTVSVIDGVVMGGGVGIALPCRYRIATERTTFAMPETGIGLFPDVGGGWYLSRLPGRAGYWLALTGARIKAAERDLGDDFVGAGGEDRGVDLAGRNGVDADAVRAEIGGHFAGETGER